MELKMRVQLKRQDAIDLFEHHEGILEQHLVELGAEVRRLGRTFDETVFADFQEALRMYRRLAEGLIESIDEGKQ